MSSIPLKPLLHTDEKLSTIREYINQMEDPRSHERYHRFESIIMIMVCASIGGANDATAIDEFAKNRREWFSRLLYLPSGIPAHDTYNRMINALDTNDLKKLTELIVEAKLFPDGDQTEKPPSTQVEALVPPSSPEEAKAAAALEEEKKYLARQICVDGKKLRAIGRTLVRMYRPSKKLTLNQARVPLGTNEIPVIPMILNEAGEYVMESIITGDAINTQTNIVDTIIQLGGDYLLAVKGNQHQLHEDIKLYLVDMIAGAFPDVDYTFHETKDKGHGRIETRKCWTTTNVGWLYRCHRWKSLASISVVETTITTIRNGKEVSTTKSYRYYISSLSVHAQIILALVRNHWGIENKLHWLLNVAFHEHIATIRKGKGAQNFALLRSLALNLLQNEPSNVSISNQRAQASFDFQYLLKVLTGSNIDMRTPTQKVVQLVTKPLDTLFVNALGITHFVFNSMRM